MKAEKRRWRERRGDGWSQTEYEGLYLEVEGHSILISRLSHGLRVLVLKDPTRYQFDQDRPVVEISDQFVHEACMALEADLRFQHQASEYERAIASAN